jgi:RimJ/RimL family protein N-acetyltransferase
MPFPDSFVTDRLRAERLTADHWPDVRRMHTDPDFMAMLGGVRDEAASAAYLQRNLGHWDEHRYGLWMLREHGGGPIVGLAVLRRLAFADVDDVEVGYGFHRDWWGRGLATEVGRACMAHAWSALALPTVVALTAPGNAASQHVLEKLGLRWEREVTFEGAPAVLFRAWRPV